MKVLFSVCLKMHVYMCGCMYGERGKQGDGQCPKESIDFKV